MKRIIFIVAVLVTFVASTITACASEKWVKKVLPSQEDIYIASPEKNITCSLVMKANGDLDLYAFDSNWNGKQVTSYSYVPSGGFAKSSMWVTEVQKTGEKAFLHNEEGGYAVFEEKCVDLALKLPAKIQRKFNGAFGVR